MVILYLVMQYWDYFRAFWHFEDIMNEIKPDVT